MDSRTRFVATISPEGISSASACDLIARHTGLSKTKVKAAMVKGAVWLRRAGQGAVQLRKATAPISPGDSITIFYDPEILDRESSQAVCLADEGRYSVWFKPPGLLSEGTKYGDHCSLLRQVALHFRPLRKVFAVHRLDREASGVILVAHDREAAAKLSSLFRNRLIQKEYRVEVRGAPGPPGSTGIIDVPLDGRQAVTEYETISHDARNNTSLLRITTKTGRLHQIRRHLAEAGFPVMGDPAYGRGNKDPRGLRLVAVSLEFTCPFSGKGRAYTTGDYATR